MALAGGTAGAMQVHAANPNAGLHQYAFAVGLGSGFGGRFPTVGLWDFGGTVAGGGVEWAAGGDFYGRGMQWGGLAGTIAGGGLTHGWRMAAWETGGALAGAGLGYGLYGTPEDALQGAYLGTLAGGLAHSASGAYRRIRGPRCLGGGVRNTADLTQTQIAELRKAAGQLGFGPDDIRFIKGPSVFSDLDNRIWIGRNILPAPQSQRIGGTVFERLSARAAIAHEGGHLVTSRAGRALQPGSLLDELQASLVGRQLPGLNKTERYQLLRYAVEMARANGKSLRGLLPQMPGLGG